MPMNLLVEHYRGVTKVIHQQSGRKSCERAMTASLARVLEIFFWLISGRKIG